MPAPHRPASARRPALRRVAVPALAAAVSLAVLPALNAPTQAVTSVTADNGATWTIHDARRPSLDTGSIRSVSQSRLEGFGNSFVKVDADPAPRLNGQMARGFELTATGGGAFASRRSVDLGGVQMTRRVDVDAPGGTAAFFDTFTNATSAPLDVEVSFGGSLGYGTGANQGVVRGSSSGDAVIDATDTWVTSAPASASLRPVGVVVGSQASDRIGNQQADPFTTAYDPATSAANYPGFVSALSLEPGETASLLRYVLVGSTGADALAPLTSATSALAAAPDVERLSAAQLCTVANWTPSELGVDDAVCAAAEPLALPAVADDPSVITDVRYDPVGKTIEQLQADLRAGVVTSEQLTQAYLDRIDAYDDGPWGFHAYISVADNALAQARAADRARAAGDDSDLLGIPIAVKDIYDTKDMPTTGGTRALAGWQPASDSHQVAMLREAGAIIIGKANLSEFANSGSFSESGFKQTWNGLFPSKSSFGSSGGSATAVAADLAAGAMGTQTGVSLYAPSVGAGLATFRGTDGLASTAGVMPLTWAQDYAGPMAKTVTDLAYLLNATSSRTTGEDPLDVLTTRVDNELRPADFTTALSDDALAGKTIGYLDSSFASTSIADDPTGPAVKQKLAELEAAGATVKTVTAPPSGGSSPGGNRGMEGWARYIELHDGFPFASGNELLGSPAVLPYNQRAVSTTPRMTDEQVAAWLAYRDQYKERIAAWMSENGVDAVVYPGFISAVGNNDASSAVLSSDRATGVLTSNVGLPTVVVPVGESPLGDSMALQIVGPAWSDAEVLGMGYALEQQTRARPTSAFAPPLQTSPEATTTSVTLNRPQAVYGQRVTATVRVASASGAAASGTVRVSAGGRTLSARLSGGTARVALPTTISPGWQRVSASFGGSADARASSGAASLRMAKAPARVGLSLAARRIDARQQVAAVIRLDRPAGTAGALPSGRVEIFAGNRLVATRWVSGRTTLRLPRLPEGRYYVHVRYAGSTLHLPQRSARVLVEVRR